MSEVIFTNLSIRLATRDRLRLMARSEGRSLAGLVALLVDREYVRWIVSRRKALGAAL